MNGIPKVQPFQSGLVVLQYIRSFGEWRQVRLSTWNDDGSWNATVIEGPVKGRETSFEEFDDVKLILAGETREGQPTYKFNTLAYPWQLVEVIEEPSPGLLPFTIIPTAPSIQTEIPKPLYDIGVHVTSPGGNDFIVEMRVWNPQTTFGDPPQRDIGQGWYYLIYHINKKGKIVIDVCIPESQIRLVGD